MPLPNPATLLHLVPASPNLRLRASRDGSYPTYVSPSTVNGRLGVEIGFHRNLKKTIGGHSIDDPMVEAITAVSTNKDLEQVHPQHTAAPIAFEVLFCGSGVNLELQRRMIIAHEGRPPNEQGLEHRVLLPYGRNVSVQVAGCAVDFHWNALVFSVNEAAGSDVLRGKAIQGHRDRKTAAGINFFKLLIGSQLPNVYWANGVRVMVKEGTMERIGRGSYGTEVHKALDSVSGNVIAVKTLRISGSQAANLHVQMLREIDGYTRTSYAHPHIVRYLGYTDAHTIHPQIFMSLHHGDVSGLLRCGAFEGSSLHKVLLLQMLQALDFLAFHNVCHRDVKPNNILYTPLGTGGYQFFLADLGMSRYALAGDTVAGTPLYMAPEVRNTFALQCPKVDVWSLLVTFMEVHPTCVAFRNAQDSLPRAQEIHDAVAQFASMHQEYSCMAHEDPAKRASAREMLYRLGHGDLIHIRRSARLAGVPADLPGLQ